MTLSRFQFRNMPFAVIIERAPKQRTFYEDALGIFALFLRGGGFLRFSCDAALVWPLNYENGQSQKFGH